MAMLVYLLPLICPGFKCANLLFNNVPLYVYLIGMLASIIQFVVGSNFYTGALKSLKQRQPNMDVLVAMSTSAAWSYGLFTIIVGYSFQQTIDSRFPLRIEEHVESFETSSALITIILLGKYLEARTKMKTAEKLSRLASLRDVKAHLIESQTLSLDS